MKLCNTCKTVNECEKLGQCGEEALKNLLAGVTEEEEDKNSENGK